MQPKATFTRSATIRSHIFYMYIYTHHTRNPLNVCIYMYVRVCTCVCVAIEWTVCDLCNTCVDLSMMSDWAFLFPIPMNKAQQNEQ